jgi:hypothetical protein
MHCRPVGSRETRPGCAPWAVAAISRQYGGGEAADAEGLSSLAKMFSFAGGLALENRLHRSNSVDRPNHGDQRRRKKAKPNPSPGHAHGDEQSRPELPTSALLGAIRVGRGEWALGDAKHRMTANEYLAVRFQTIDVIRSSCEPA